MTASIDRHLQASRRWLLRAGASILAAPCAARGLVAPGDGGMRIVCSGPAGSIPDLVARTVAAQLPAAARHRVLVDNRPGAAGRLSIAALKSAPADGATLLLAQGAIATVYPTLYGRLDYDPDRDLLPVSLAAEMSLGLAVGPAVPAGVATLADFIAWARRHPVEVNLGSPGTGTLPHLLEAMLMHDAGAAWQHVPYGGGPPALNDLLGGQIAALVLPEGLLRPHHVARRLRVLATSGAARSATLPDVPTFIEQGHRNLVIKEWFAFFAPGRTPREVIAALSADLRQALARPGVAIAFAPAGMTPVPSPPQALADRIAAERRDWQAVLQARGIRAE